MVTKSLLCFAIIGLAPVVLSQHNEKDVKVENNNRPVCEYEVFSSNLTHNQNSSSPVKINRPSKCSHHFQRYRPGGKKHVTQEKWRVDGWYFRCPSQKMSDITLYAAGNLTMKITCWATYPLNVTHMRALESIEPEEDELAGLVVRTEEIDPGQYRIEVEFPRTLENNQESLSDFTGRFTFFNYQDESNLQTQMVVSLSVIDENHASEALKGK
ncbi:unnamed protein product [Allacma fusca]|uniref:Uncharacterized protein n=1 Tax=Allacma fusca TaxID=39272 RepID=A0A8J2L227_9HEXA|nr:unnamed protein product [Allacma fusca]